MDTRPPEVSYVFEDDILQVICDLEREIVQCIFLRAAMHRGFQLSEVPFDHTRLQVLSQFGTPEESGKKSRDSVLGDLGAWDRFQFQGHVVHIEYQFRADKVEMITLMQDEIAP